MKDKVAEERCLFHIKITFDGKANKPLSFFSRAATSNTALSREKKMHLQ